MHTQVLRSTDDRKKYWYRITEREKVNTKTTLKIGDTVSFSRTIDRCGYWWQPEDMPEQLTKERAMSYLAGKATMNYRTYDTGVRGGSPLEANPKTLVDGTLDFTPPSFSQFKDRPEITPDMIRAVEDAAGLLGDRFWRHIYYIVRGQWLDETRYADKEHDCRFRTFYYVDNTKNYWEKDPRLLSGVIMRKSVRLIGEYYSPTSSPGGWWDNGEGDYYPGGIANAVRQTVLHIRVEEEWDRSIMIHPLDAIVNQLTAVVPEETKNA